MKAHHLSYTSLHETVSAKAIFNSVLNSYIVSIWLTMNHHWSTILAWCSNMRKNETIPDAKYSQDKEFWNLPAHHFITCQWMGFTDTQAASTWCLVKLHFAQPSNRPTSCHRHHPPLPWDEAFGYVCANMALLTTRSKHFRRWGEEGITSIRPETEMGQISRGRVCLTIMPDYDVPLNNEQGKLKPAV